jgi:hypothetical protein
MERRSTWHCESGNLRPVRTLFRILVACAAIVLAPSRAPGETEIEIVPDSAVYGVYPMAYQDIITKWLDTQLIDAPSAQIEWSGPPQASETKGADGKRVFGYLVEFKVNARNKFGMYTGKQKHRAFIRNGEVIASGRVRSSRAR